MKLTLGFSPCPNDTFIFDALVNGKIDTEGIVFDPVLEDVETLNKWALEDKLDISKLSFPALFQTTNKYAVLSSGSALGNGVGPLLISKNPISPDSVNEQSIAIPGWNTTANFLLYFAFPQAANRTPILFSDIENEVLRGNKDLGLIIHENRFTYAQRGLYKVMDLGEYWEKKTGLPIPLGCIATRRSFAKEQQLQVQRLIRKSLEFAFSNYPQLPAYVEAHAQEMDKAVMRQHIDLYVNNYSLELGDAGKKAIEKLYAVYCSQKEHAAQPAASLFV
jgi:1,4-dihydroxy-6-naphthoate synthase